MRAQGAGPSDQHADDGYSRSSFVLISIATFLVMIGLSMLSPVLATLSMERGLSSVQVGLLLGAFPLGRVICAVPSGLFADRFTMGHAASLGCLLTMAASMGAGLAHDFTTLLTMQFLQGVGSSLHTTAALAFIMAIVPTRRVGRLLATHQGIVLLGVSFSPVLGGIAVTVAGVNGPFWMYAGVVAVAWCCSLLAVRSAAKRQRVRGSCVRLRPAGPARTGGPATRLELLRHRTFAVSLVVGFGLHWMVSGIRNTLVPLFAELELGFQPLAVGLILGAAAGANGIALLLAGRLIDRVGRRPLLVYGCLAVVVLVALMSLSGPWSLVVLLLALGAANGYANAAPPAVLADVVDPGIRGAAVGVQRTFTGLGLWSGPVSIGYLVTVVSYRGAFVAAAVLLALMLFWAWFARETLPRAS